MRAIQKGDKRCIVLLREFKESEEMVTRTDRLHLFRL
jgi:hypothetical protein